MARMYEVPPNINEKEKIFGGYFNINQVGWFILGLIIGVILFLSTANLLGKVLSAFCFVIGAASSLPFVFYKKHGLTLFQLIVLRKRFKKQQKIYLNRQQRKECY